MEQSAVSLIVSLVGNFIRFIILFQFLSVFFYKGTKKTIFIRCLAFFAYFIINSLGSFFFSWTPPVLLITSISGMFLMTLTYQGSWKMRIIAFVLVSGINVVLEDLAYRILITLKTEYVTALILVITDLLLLMCMLIASKIMDFKRGEQILFSEWLAIVLIPATSILFSACVLDQCKSESTAFLGGICMLILNIIVFYLLSHLNSLRNRQLDLLLIEQENKAYENQVRELTAADQSIRAIRHDIKNHLLVLGEMVRNNDFSGVEKYIGYIGKCVEESEPLVKTGNIAIDSLLNSKLNVVKTQLHIEPEIDIVISETLRLEKYDVCIILGNLLDNAIEALEKCDEGALKIVMHEYRGTLSVHISNSYDGVLSKDLEGFITTKTNSPNHGIGLKNVKGAIEKYHGELKFTNTNNIFTVNVFLYL